MKLAMMILVMCSAWAGEPALGEAVAMPDLRGGVFKHQCVVVGQRLYIISRNGHVTWTTVAGDGSVGPWHQRANETFPDGIGDEFFTAAAWRDRIYVLGGTSDGEQVATVAMASVGADGYLTEWVTTTALPRPVAGAMSIVVDGFLYVAGGQYVRDVVMAPILEDGQLGAWLPTRRLPYSRSGGQLLAHGDYMYLIGGWAVHGRPTASAFRAKRQDDGTLEKWRHTEELPEPRSHFAAVLMGDTVFVMGGMGEDGPTASTLCTSIGEDQHFGDWSTLPPLPYDASGMQAARVDDWLYLIGGITLHEEGNHVWKSVWRFRPTHTTRGGGQ